ncbi:unnamed protein product [Bursaphelenchus okinawaensis]|uniref:Uncharacterized protein n=1 Tax=Bursaphelenchus okinawaensis TaxID=465554 RepID=A0A811JVW5_9BILA|nr:unnamed protein product [Bursaphelenchus okinawaensis]CAG9085707.1 unnamed protein product [Bursaphelenchus okinawaensis]
MSTSAFLDRNYEWLDAVLVVIQRILLAIQVLCGFEVPSTHGVENGSNFVVRHLVRVSRNYYILAKDFRSRLASACPHRIALPELQASKRYCDTKHSSPASTSEPPPECDESAIKQSLMMKYNDSIEVGRFETLNLSSLAHKVVTGLVGVIHEPHSFTVLAGLIPLEDEAFVSLTNSPVRKYSEADVTMKSESLAIQDDASSVKEIEGDQIERKMPKSSVRGKNVRRQCEMKTKFNEKPSVVNQDEDIMEPSVPGKRIGTPHPVKSAAKKNRKVVRNANSLNCTPEVDEFVTSDDLSSFFEGDEKNHITV